MGVLQMTARYYQTSSKCLNIEKSELKNTFTVKLIVRHCLKWETFPRIENDILNKINSI